MMSGAAADSVNPYNAVEPCVVPSAHSYYEVGRSASSYYGPPLTTKGEQPPVDRHSWMFDYDHCYHFQSVDK